MTESYYRNVDALLLLYDISSYYSFEYLVRWLEKYPSAKSGIPHLVLIGNKIDKSQRVVPRQIAERLADDYQMSYLETSAKTGQNVELAFLTTAQILHDKQEKLEQSSIHSTIKLGQRQRARDRCC